MMINQVQKEPLDQVVPLVATTEEPDRELQHSTAQGGTSARLV